MGMQYAVVLGGVQTGLTALAGGGASGATAITGAFATVTTVATDNDSAILPAGMPQGARIVVANLDSAQDVKVFPNTGGTINGAAANTGLAVGQQQTAEFIQIGTDGLTWIAMLGAVATPA
jgi:hypothetical protein